MPEPSQTLFNLEKCNTSGKNNRFGGQPSGTWTLTVACLIPFSQCPKWQPPPCSKWEGCWWVTLEQNQGQTGETEHWAWSYSREFLGKECTGLNLVIRHGPLREDSPEAQVIGINLHGEPKTGIFNLWWMTCVEDVLSRILSWTTLYWTPDNMHQSWCRYKQSRCFKSHPFSYFLALGVFIIQGKKKTWILMVSSVFHKIQNGATTI